MTEKQYAAKLLQDSLTNLVNNTGLTTDVVATALGKKHVKDATVEKVNNHLKKLVEPVVKRCDKLLNPKPKKKKEPVEPAVFTPETTN